MRVCRLLIGRTNAVCRFITGGGHICRHAREVFVCTRESTGLVPTPCGSRHQKCVQHPSPAILAGRKKPTKDEPHKHTSSSKNEPAKERTTQDTKRGKASAATHLLQGLHSIAVEQNGAVLLGDRHDAAANTPLALPPLPYRKLCLLLYATSSMHALRM